MLRFDRPPNQHVYDLATEIAALDAEFGHPDRGVPARDPDHLLLATWNIANLGAQDRIAADLTLIAHIIRRFDLIAIQEVKDDMTTFLAIMDLLGDDYDYMISDNAGNFERLAFVYRPDTVTPGKMFGEIAIPAKDFPRRTVEVAIGRASSPTVYVFPDFEFSPFDRNPYLGTFHWGDERLLLANVHLYFGKKKNEGTSARLKYVRRVLEIHALAQWAKERTTNTNAYTGNIILLGDMNIPEMEPDNPAFLALMDSGYHAMPYPTRTGGDDLPRGGGGSNLGGSETYDQIAMTPGIDPARVGSDFGVFSMDLVLFKALWDELFAEIGATAVNAAEHKADTVSAYNDYMKAYISDHRPIWIRIAKST